MNGILLKGRREIQEGRGILDGIYMIKRIG
jgi:hypothetical protein